MWGEMGVIDFVIENEIGAFRPDASKGCLII